MNALACFRKRIRVTRLQTMKNKIPLLLGVLALTTLSCSLIQGAASSQTPTASFPPPSPIVVSNANGANCPTPQSSPESVGLVKVVPAQVVGPLCDYVPQGSQVFVSWPEVPKGSIRVTFYFNTPQMMGKADVIGVDEDLTDGAGITWTFYGGVGSLYALSEWTAQHSAVWSGTITLTANKNAPY